MSPGLKEHLDFFEQADREAHYEGDWPLEKLARLTDLLASASGDLHANVNFGRLGEHRFLRGSVRASLVLVCQRCLQEVTMDVDEDFCLGLIATDDDASHLPEQYEPLVVSDSVMSLIDIFEDALILAIPMIPVHREVCSEYVQAQGTVDKNGTRERENPFAVLKDLVK